MAPRKRTTGFPGMDERRALMEELKDLDSNEGEQFHAYVEAIRKLDTLMARYSEPDLLTDLAPALQEKDKKTLMDAIRQTALAGEAYLAIAENSRADMTQGAPALAEKLQGLLSLDYNILNQYKAEYQRSLPELQEDARTLTVDIRGVPLETVGGAQSSRVPMTVVDADGSRREGFFTKESKVTMLGTMQFVLNNVKRGCQQQEKDELDQFVEKYRVYLDKKTRAAFEKEPNNKGKKYHSLTQEQAIGFLAHSMPSAGKFKPGFARDTLIDAGVDVSKLSDRTLRLLDKGFQEMKKDTFNIININYLSLRDGSRLDNRNAAMSSVSELLGVPDLVAKAVPMRCIDQKGNLVEGTFMEKAKGYNLERSGDLLCHAYARVDDQPYAESSNLVKDLADLQALDYLCCNVDRHSANMFYKVDDNGKIVGVQAIDNDSSFGRRHNMKKNNLRLVGTNNLGIMSESMAERLEKMTPDMLKLSLRGRGLSREELEAACLRLTDLQNKIRDAHRCEDVGNKFPQLDPDKTKLNILKDEEMKLVDMRMLSDRYKDSLFNFVDKAVTESLQRARHYGHDRKYFEKHPEEFVEQPVGEEVVTSDRKFTAAGMADTLGEAARLYKNEATGFEIKDYTGYWTRSSGEFRDMVRAAENAARVQKRLAQTFSREVNRQKLLRDDQRVLAEKELADETMRNLEAQTTRYLQRKMNQRGVDNVDALLDRANGEYERNRIDYALKLRKAVNTYKRLDNPEAKEEQQQKLDVKTRLEAQQKRQALAQDQEQPQLIGGAG